MEWELIKPWASRTGIVLEFLSFWLVAPEILGEERLMALERRVKRMLDRASVLMFLLFSFLISAMPLLMFVLIRGTPETVVATLASMGATRATVLITVVALASIAVSSALGFILEVSERPENRDPIPMILFATVLAVVVIALVSLPIRNMIRSIEQGTITVTDAKQVLQGPMMPRLIFLIILISSGGATVCMGFFSTIVLPLMAMLADNKSIRRRSLIVGAVLFITGILLQLVATF